MLETPHVAFGIAIAKAVPNPWISIPLSFAGHFLLDMAPHWNPHLNTEIKNQGRLTNKTLLIIAVDSITAIFLTFLVLKFFSGNKSFSITILLSSLASVLPDLVEFPYYLMGIKNKFLNFWVKFQKSIQNDVTLFWGITTQIIVLAVCLIWIFFS